MNNIVPAHKLARVPLSPQASLRATNATFAYSKGRYFEAAGFFAKLAYSFDGIERAKLLVRAGTAFDIASQNRWAARAYDDAASLLPDDATNNCFAGELHNRAAHQYVQCREYFNAGTAWRKAATRFEKLGNKVLRLDDNIYPVPTSAAGLTIAGMCFVASGEAYELATGNEMWACGSFWLGGRAYQNSFPSPNIQTFDSYKLAILATIRHYKTLEINSLRNSLPLTEVEREAKIDPIAEMINSLSNVSLQVIHKEMSSTGRRAALARFKSQLRATYHDFALELEAISNGREASAFRVQEMNVSSAMLWNEGNYVRWSLYQIWRTTSQYGENIVRWIATCVIALVAFATSYWITSSIEATHWFDYIYFSIVTFSSLGYGDLKPISLIGKILACVEILAGLTMFGILLSIVGRKIQSK